MERNVTADLCTEILLKVSLVLLILMAVFITFGVAINPNCTKETASGITDVSPDLHNAEKSNIEEYEVVSRHRVFSSYILTVKDADGKTRWVSVSRGVYFRSKSGSTVYSWKAAFRTTYSYTYLERVGKMAESSFYILFCIAVGVIVDVALLTDNKRRVQEYYPY